MADSQEKEIVIGIDPGKTGAVAVLDMEGRVLDVVDMPTQQVSGKRALVGGADFYEAMLPWIGHPSDTVVGLEDTFHTRFANSSFQLGIAWAAAKYVFEVAGHTVLGIASATWKRHFNLIGEGKDKALELAREIFPELAEGQLRLKKHHNRAEALLIGLYTVRQVRGEIA